MTRLTSYLFLTLAILITITIVFNGYKQAVVDSTNDTAPTIRKAGR